MWLLRLKPPLKVRAPVSFETGQFLGIKLFTDVSLAHMSNIFRIVSPEAITTFYNLAGLQVSNRHRKFMVVLCFHIM